MTLDFAWPGPPDWTIRLVTEAGTALLLAGGSRLQLPGAPEQVFADEEYPGLYRHFASLIAAGRSDCDFAPLALTEAALRIGTDAALQRSQLS